MKIIDMRLRPPLPSMLDAGIFDIESTQPFARLFDRSYMGKSAIERSIPLLLQEMDENNIEIGVMALRKGKDGKLLEEAAALMDQYPGRFIAFLGVDAGDVDDALAGINDHIIQGRFSGINIEPAHAGMYASDERLFPIYEKCEQNNIPINMTFAGALPDATACMPHRLEPVLKAFPDLRICLSHGAWPWFTQITSLLFSYPNLYVSSDSYIMGMPGYMDYIHAANSCCENQLIFGSCYPIHDIKKVVDFYMHAGFREDVLPKVFYDNAAHFLGLDTTDPAPWRHLPKACPIVDLSKK